MRRMIAKLDLTSVLDLIRVCFPICAHDTMVAGHVATDLALFEIGGNLRAIFYFARRYRQRTVFGVRWDVH
jgi:hypothetical protein